MSVRDAKRLASAAALAWLTAVLSAWPRAVARAQPSAAGGEASAPAEPDRTEESPGSEESPGTGGRADPIAPGFTPDPLRVEGRTVGAQPLSERAPGCRGYVGERPDHVLELGRRFDFLRLFVTSPVDVTLALRGPDGRWHCTGRPLLRAPAEEGAREAGPHEVWIGSVRPGTQADYALFVTEFRSVTPTTRVDRASRDRQAAGLGLAVDAEAGRFADRRLRRGFLPDPQRDEGRAGGPIDVSSLGAGCRGFVDAAPSHVLTLDGELDYFRVSVRDADAPVTMLVRSPEGELLCASPAEGPPTLEGEAWSPGTYRVWVGRRAPGSETPYRVEYTETRAAAAP
jgi:hypothetical protein